jgi:hypothetical protein
MSTKIQLRRDTSTNWTRNNPVLALGEPGLETDTLIVKYGDGSSSWNDLQYANLNSLADFTTTTLAEGSNLYFSNTRVYANVTSIGFASNTYVNTLLSTKANISDLTTDFVTESTRQYYTDARVYSNVSIIGYASIDYVDALTTDAITEGTNNLYFSNARVESALTSTSANISFGSPIRLRNYTYDSMFLIDTPLTGEFIYETSNNVFRGYDGSNWIASTKSTDLTTANVSEVNNLYFSNDRVTSALTSSTANVTLGNVMRLVNYTYDEMEALTGAEKGWIIFETSNNVFRGYNGTAWSNLG